MLHQVRYFQAVVRCNSFTQAAKECQISQSAISQQVQALEKELGVQLMQRENRRFIVTPAGMHFYKQSLRLVAYYDKMVQETVSIDRQDRSQMKIGVLRFHARRELKRALSQFEDRYPNIEPILVTGSEEELAEQLSQGQVDLVLTDSRGTAFGEATPFSLATSYLYVNVAAKSEVAGRLSVTAPDLYGVPCVLIAAEKDREDEVAYYRALMAYQGDFRYAEDGEDAKRMVIRGEGFLVSENDPGKAHQGMMTCRIPLHLDGRQITLEYCAYRASEQPQYFVEAFLEMLQEKMDR